MVTTADQNLVRKFNTAVVLNTIRHHAPLSRAEVAKFTGLNRSTVSQIINTLLDRKLVQETILQSDRIGRPGLLLELNPSGGFAIGIEIGVDYISLVVTDFLANVLWRQRLKSDSHDSIDQILDRAYLMTEDGLKKGYSLNLAPLGIGLGVPGLVDLLHGELKFAPNLGWSNIPLTNLWAQRFNLPVFVDNEAKAAALGEYYFGAARGEKNFIFLTAGVGLGAGIMIDGKLFRGSHGFASEVGHMIVEPGGELCGCGKRGCWETQVSPRAVIKHFKEVLKRGEPSTVLDVAEDSCENTTFEMIANAASKGDLAAITAMQEVGERLGFGIANLVNVFNPDMVILGGELNYASDVILPVVRRIVNENSMKLESLGLKIVPSAHGRDACVMGAVALVLDDILHEPNFK
ncbi:MAG: ROK family transcriptional regulator [Leptolinea sp.]|jgi:glucokinase-like ROK family protein|nr:ROK family transcriptional regulator [Leptolinea sp.]